MKKVYIIYTGFILAIFFSTIAIGQITVFEDNFDSYIASQQISCQASTIWKTWTNNPCSATEDAYISNAYSFSGNNTLKIIQNNDIVKEIGSPITSGIAEINFQVFIPTGKSGYFNTLTNFNPSTSTYAWAMQVFLNANGTGTIDAQGANSATFSFPQNQWFPIKIVSDLTADSGKFYLNGNLIRRWQWSKGTFGTSNDKRLDGNDFFGYVATDEMYIDDYNIVQMTSSVNKIISTAIGGNWNSGSTWIGGIIPLDTLTVEIVKGATVILSDNVNNRNKSTLVNGVLNCGNYSISGSGDFCLGGGGTLQIGSSNGITLSGSLGNIQVSGTRSFNQYANYVYDGIGSQVTGNGLPLIVRSLTISNPSGVTLSSNTTVSNTLNLVDGELNTNSHSFSLGTSFTNLGGLTFSSGRIIGDINRWVSNSISPITFPVGTSSTEYTPVTLSNVVGSGNFTVGAVNGPHPNRVGDDILQMYWKLTNVGITSTDITFNYLDADVVGNELLYELGSYNTGWVFPTGTNNTPNYDFTANIVFISGVSSFSDWTLGLPTALPVELTSFNATTIGKNVKLTWETKTEVNNYGFEVERMIVNQNENWKKIGFVNGNGNSNSPKDYSFIDSELESGKYLYRLKQIDNDGQFKYSHVVDVLFNKPTEFSLNQNYPNPFNPTTKIGFSIPAASNVKIRVFNLIGEEIVTLVDEYKEAGYHTINYIAKNLNSGIYLYKIEAGSFSQTKKMTFIK